MSFVSANMFETPLQNFEQRTLMLIKHFIVNLSMQSWEIDWFQKLGNDIMLQLHFEVYPTDPEKLKLLGPDTPEKQSERLKKIKDNMKAKMSRHAYGDYPWNSVSLALRLQPAVSSPASYFRSQLSSFSALTLFRVSVLPICLKEKLLTSISEIHSTSLS